MDIILALGLSLIIPLSVLMLVQRQRYRLISWLRSAELVRLVGHIVGPGKRGQPVCGLDHGKDDQFTMEAGGMPVAVLSRGAVIRPGIFRRNPELNRAAHGAARKLLEQSIKEVQQAGLLAQCVTFPQVLDDLADGDDDLQDALDIPVHGLPWDELSFMVYQSTYAKIVGSWIGPDLVRRYAAEAYKAYGSKGTIALGVVGKAGVMLGGAKLYADPATLRADVAAALSQKIRRVEVFSLDGVLGESAPDAWLGALAGVQPQEPSFGFQAELVMRTMRGLDALLDRD